AVSFRLTSIYARPLEVDGIDKAASDIAAVLGVDKAGLSSLLRTERSFVWLGRQLSASQAEKILGLKIPGIYGVDVMYRFYPHKQLAGPVLGFVKDGQGLAGIEFQYDNVLRGIAGKDADLASAGLPLQGDVEGKGADLALSIDLSLQSLVEKRLGEVIRKSDSASGVAVVMDSESGAILAMASLPAFDPNKFWDSAASNRRNRAVVGQVFPGELNRLFKAAAAYELRGQIAKVDRGDNADHWQQDSAGVYVSSNLVGIAGPVIDDPMAHGFVNRLALRDGADIDLPAEQGEGNERLFDVDEVKSSISAINLLTAFARVLNDGVLVKPRLLAGVRSAGGEWEVPLISKVGSSGLRPGFGLALGDALAVHGREVIVESRVAEKLVEDRTGQKMEPEAKDSSLGEEMTVKATVDDDRYYATMLGRGAGTGARLVMVAALSGARFNPAAGSTLAGMGRKILSAASALSLDADKLLQAAPSANEKELYAAWQKLREQPDDQRKSTPTRSAGVMPDVTGYSLRKALQVLQTHGLPIRVQGNGLVVSQKPAAAASLKGVHELVITLQLVQ
ncbi:MAG: penicillin-binding transpeptidase domain-containing protein, partial [Desulfobulbaceae bacterium]|nr:penicillin-binding transpeptidase domain-containing protein [Desulfobulbaceae bacterium]